MNINQKTGQFKGFVRCPLQAVVVVGLPLDIGLVEGLVGVQAEHGGFDGRVL